AIDGRFHAAGMAWSAICVAVAWWGVRSTVVVEPAIRERPVSNANAPLERGRGPMRTLLRRDVRLLGSDGLLVALTVGLPVMFALVRLALAFGGEWLEVRGVDVASIAPIVPGFVVIHTAGIMGTVLGLALLEDRDAGVLAAISVTPLRLPGVVLVRAALMGCATAFLVIVGALVVGLAPAAGMRVLPLVAVGSCFLAILHGVTLSTLASDRVRGVGLMKILALPLYAPLAMWFLPFPAEIPLLLIPSAWPLSVWWARSPTVAMAWTLGGVALSLSMTAMLVRRMGRTMGV
ncbi:MAG: hypothetical protein R3246_16180, partial [Acidimicrobiia bacterium]|nr:hypothetical protein [Acidimicrobiia bacterium]